MPPAIQWVPTGETTTQTVTFPRNPTKFAGFRDAKIAQTVTLGGAAVSVFHDSFSVYDLELRGFGPSVSATFFEGLTSWWSHAAAGGEWQFLLDSGDSLNTTMSAGTTSGATTISVNSTATLATSDWVYVEDASDASKFEARKVSAIGATTLTFTTGLSRAYSSGSTVRHLEYFPSCIAIGSECPFEERMAGQGNRVYDLKLKFRTVR